MNNKPEFIDIQDYDYDLPEERIAKYPLETRDASKLLLYQNGKIENRLFLEIPELLTEKHHLVFNDTRVIHARLLFNKLTGSGIEIFLLEPFQPSEYNLSFSSRRECSWKCLVGNAKKWKNEVLQKEIIISNRTFFLKAELLGREENFFIISFSWDNDSFFFSEIIEQAGSTPIPPYLNRAADAADSDRYQTVYSQFEGSVAAPTAGLHFTESILQKLIDNGVSRTRLTLHVGAGTFVPVKAANACEHEMHTEHIYLSRSGIESLLNSQKKIIAVGTTSVRTLESIYHISAKIKHGAYDPEDLILGQWEAYETQTSLSRKEALENVLVFMQKQKTETLKISTRIMITSGYKFKMADGIITNFHQPVSTLLLLISAFIGDDWKKVYEHALKNHYRFLSYGDSSLLLR